MTLGQLLLAALAKLVAAYGDRMQSNLELLKTKMYLKCPKDALSVGLGRQRQWDLAPATRVPMKQLLVALLVAVSGLGLPIRTSHAEQIKVSGGDVLSLGDHGKILNSTVYACRMPNDPTAYGWLQRMNAHLIAKGQSGKPSPDGECWPLAAGTEVKLAKTDDAYPDVVCVRLLGGQSCGWTFKLGIEPVNVYDAEQSQAKKIGDDSNRIFDRLHPECKDFRTNPNLPAYCY